MFSHAIGCLKDGRKPKYKTAVEST